jgi:AcrR family transcriptional regulator
MDAKETRDQVVRDAKSSLILDAALKVFAEKGFHETRLDDIALVAGFSKASLYNYYEDKESIFLQILIRMHEKILEALKTEIRKDRHIKENLTAMIRAVFRIYSENFSFSMGMNDLKSMAPISMEKFQKHHEHLMSRFKHYSREITDLSVSVFSIARQRGEISSQIEDKTLTQYIASLMRGVIFDCKMAGKIGDPEKQVKSLVEFLTNGLGLKAASPSV